MHLLERIVVGACCGLASVTIHLAPASAAFDALYSGPKLYCVPGVTASRCRGTFWETGSLYKKGQEGGVLSPDEYAVALARIDELQELVRSLGPMADRGEAEAVGDAVAKVRAELRIKGERVVRSAFVGDERIDEERRLLALLAVLDDIDREAEVKQTSSAITAPGFGTLRLMLDSASKRFNEYREALPSVPDPDAF